MTHPQEAAEAHVARFELTLPPELTLRTDTSHLAISPDGRLVAFSACADSDCRLYLRELADPAPRAVDGTSGASAPFFSPDGRALGYFADGKLKKAMLAGGAVSVLCDAPDALGATWLDDGRVVFASHELGGLEAVSENGGVPSPLTRVDVRAGELGHRQPRWLPGTDFVVFTATSSLADPDGGRIIALSLDNGRTRVVTGRARSARLIAPDILVHGRGTHLLAMRFDGVRGVPTTAPVALVGELRSADDGELLLAASASGTVLMVPGPPGTRAREVLAGLGHRAVARSLEPFREIALDPQGSRLAGIVPDGLKGDLWVGDASRGTVMRLTHDHPAAQPVWSVDGRRVIYSGAADGVFNLWMADAETSSTRRVTRSPLHQFATSVTGDGQIVYTQIDPASRGDIWMADSHGRVTALMKTAFDERGGAVSPDGRWLAYLSDESGRWQVYAKALHGATRFTVSRAGADRAWWLADGRLVYTTIGGQVDEVTIAADGRVEAGRTRTFAPAVIEAIAASGALLLSRDGSLRPRPVLTLNALREIARALPPGVTTLPR